MSDLLTKIVKEQAKNQELPSGLDQRFFQKLNEQKKMKIQAKKENSPSLLKGLLDLFAPIGVFSALASLVVLITLHSSGTLDWEARSEVLSNLQNEEIQELSTLSDGQWDQLFDAAEGVI